LDWGHFEIKNEMKDSVMNEIKEVSLNELLEDLKELM
jgi:hypothetical protein